MSGFSVFNFSCYHTFSECIYTTGTWHQKGCLTILRKTFYEAVE